MPFSPKSIADPRLQQTLVVLESSSAQSCLPILRDIIEQDKKAHTLLFSLLYEPSSLVSGTENSTTIDWTTRIPGYDDKWSDPREEMLRAVRNAPPGSLTLIVDSVDTLTSDIGSISKTYKLIQDLLNLICARSSGSRLILHILSPCDIIPLVTSTSLCSALTYVTAHPSVLFTHLAAAYLTPPPPASSPEKFWGVFIPIRDRGYESEDLVFGSNGEGSSEGSGEFVVEILVRGSGRRKSVERELEGWSSANGLCDLTTLESLKSIWTKKTFKEAGPDPTQNVTFNLNLTPSQQQSRAQVPLPYAHEGKPPEKTTTSSAAIFYDPDSADDIDDDDPDEDLDI